MKFSEMHLEEISKTTKYSSNKQWWSNQKKFAEYLIVTLYNMLRKTIIRRKSLCSLGPNAWS